MKTIGVLGIGPQATMDFVARLYGAARRVIPAPGSRGHFPLVVWHHGRPPVAVREDGSPVLPLRVDPELLRAAEWLGARADFLVMTANAPHVFLGEIEAAAARPLLSIIDATLAEVRRRGWRRIGVLGFKLPEVPVYTEPMRAMGLSYETVDAARQERIDDAVLSLIGWRETDAHRAAVRDAVDSLRARGVDGVIPGCTELPLLLGPEADAPDLVNPAELLAAAAVREASEGG